MRDEFLFSVVPRVAMLSGVLAAVMQPARIRWRNDAAGMSATADDAAVHLNSWWRISVALIVVGHIAAFAFPSAFLLWNQQPVRLIVLESAGWLAGAIALVGFIVMAVRHRWAVMNRHAPSPLDVITATLLLLELVSGLAIAMRYRWASSWSAVTLTPYVHSLITSRPSVGLVTSMPFLVELHVFGAFAVIAVAPWSGLTRAVLVAAQGMRRTSLRPIRKEL